MFNFTLKMNEKKHLAAGLAGGAHCTNVGEGKVEEGIVVWRSGTEG